MPIFFIHCPFCKDGSYLCGDMIRQVYFCGTCFREISRRDLDEIGGFSKIADHLDKFSDPKPTAIKTITTPTEKA